MESEIMGVKQRVISRALVFSCAMVGMHADRASSNAADSPENIAREATISATSEHSADYVARHVADGRIPAPMSHADVGKAWCVKGNNHPDGVRLTFTWSAPVRIAELAYHGRTAWEWEENWKDYKLRGAVDSEVIATGQLKPGHGPQRIPLPEPVTTKSLVLEFISSYGGSNPGASEIEVFSTARPDTYYESFAPPTRSRSKPAVAESKVPESDALAGRLRAGELGFNSLLVIERHAVNPSHVYTYHVEGQKPGGGLYRLDLAPPGDARSDPELTRLVDATGGLVLDANLCYDGKTVLFAWKQSMSDTLQLYTINIDGSELRQLTNHDSNNLNACWLPDDSIAFLSDRKPAYAYCWTSSTPILYRCDRDGDNVRRLSANYLNDFTPSVMDDGRIVYSRWEYVDRPAIPIQSLWTINPDGTALSGLFGNRVLSPATFMEAHEIPGTGTLLCILTSHNGPCRGAIGIIDPSEGANAQEAIHNLTPEIDVGRVDKGNGNHIRGPYESPFPIDDEVFLVSRGGTILVRDYKGTEQATILEKGPTMGFYTPRPVMSRSRPPLRSAAYELSDDGWASVLVEDVYKGLGVGGTAENPPPRISRIAVVQEVEKSEFADVERRAFGFQFPVVSCGATYAPKKVWGFADVEKDGSAHFQVPARVPIYFMALDQHGRAVQRMRSFTHFMPGERHSCVGCHADRNYVTPDVSADPVAARKPPQELLPPEWGARGFSYPRIVQPVLDQHCLECHNARQRDGGIDLSGDKTDFFNVSYETLARQGRPGENPYTKWIPTFNGQEANILQITPSHWGSPASKLADIVLNGHPDEEGKPRIEVDPISQRRIFTWIDLNVPYYGTSASNHYDLTGCRRIVPEDLEKVLEDVAARRCTSCHTGKQGLPRAPFLRITNVEHNDFLMAPLAKSAGGTQRCGQPVFSSRDDPDYRAILETFRSVKKRLSRTPRMDMAEAGTN
ncbi:MAG: hypothetical protein ACQESR_29955 [Planctomycetota bacterium]